MVERTVDLEILKSINKYVSEIKKHYNISTVILFGSYAKGNDSVESDIDIAIVSEDFEDLIDSMADLMGLTWEIDARIEPHPIRKKDYDEVSDYFIKEIIDTGIKVA